MSPRGASPARRSPRQAAPENRRQTLRFTLRPARPYSLARTVARLVRFEEVVNRLEDGAYVRLLPTPGGPTQVRVRQVGPPSRAELRVELHGRVARRPETRRHVERTLSRILGTTQAVRPFYTAARDDPLLAPLTRRFSGLRVAGMESLFEALVTAVLAQQIQLTFAYHLRAEIVRRHGRRARLEGLTRWTFPTPRALAAADPDALRALGLSRAKVRALLGIAGAFAAGELREDALAELPDEEVIEKLLPLRGVGRWTAEIGLLRGLGRMDAFPGADLAVIKYLAVDLLGRPGPARESEMRAVAERWRPHRGLALAYLLEELEHRKRTNPP